MGHGDPTGSGGNPRASRTWKGEGYKTAQRSQLGGPSQLMRGLFGTKVVMTRRWLAMPEAVLARDLRWTLTCLRDSFNRPINYLRISVTDRCNFRCVYCFEDNDTLESLSSNTLDIEQFMKWLEQYKKIFQFKKLGVVFYGGEPLLSEITFLNCLTHLKAWSNNNAIDFHFSIITNGYLLTERLIKIMINSGLREVQITIDGPKEIHNKRRSLKNGEGTFNVIINNLKMILNCGVKVALRINIDRHNAKSIGALMEILQKEKIFPNNNLRVATGLVDPCPFKPEWNKQFVPQTFKERVQFMKEAKIGMFSNVDDPNVLLKEHKLQFGLCHAKIDNYFIVGADGIIYTCYSLIGYKDGACGSIITGLTQKYSEFMYYSDEKVRKCLEEKCPFVPICNGGCMYQSYIEHGDFTKRVCQRNYFETVWIPLRAQIYERMINKST